MTSLTSVCFECSNTSPLVPCQMTSWDAGTAPDYIITENIAMLGTNLLDPILNATPPASFTYQLTNGTTITVSTYGNEHSATLGLSMSQGSSFSGTLFIYNDQRIIDGLYIAMDPYTSDLADVTNWGIIQHNRENNKWGYRWIIRTGANYYNQFNGAVAEDEYEPPQATGVPDMDIQSQEVDFPSLPTLNFLDTCMISVYSPTTGEVQSFANYLWTGSFFTNIAKINNDPLEAVIGFNILPITPTTSSTTIKIGNTDSGVSSKQVTQQYYYIDFGKIAVKTYMGTFYDWAPYTRADIYLPFVGVRQLDINEIMGSELQLKYMVDILTGSFTAMLKITRTQSNNGKENLKSILYHWNGNMSVQGCLTARDFTQQIKSEISAALGMGAMIAAAAISPPTAAVGAGMVAGATGLTAGAMTTPTPVEHSGSLTASSGMLGVQTPYVILSRPNPVIPSQVKRDSGLAAHQTVKVSSCSGFTKYSDIHVDSIAKASDGEISEIESLLLKGIII